MNPDVRKMSNGKIDVHALARLGNTTPLEEEIKKNVKRVNEERYVSEQKN